MTDRYTKIGLTVIAVALSINERTKRIRMLSGQEVGGPPVVAIANREPRC